MTFKNFRLLEIKDQQIIEIDSFGQVFDLHNAAEFLKLEYTVKPRMLTLFWNYYFDEKTILPIRIRFENTKSFEILPRDNEMPLEEDDCLEQIVYGDAFEFRFRGGMKIVVVAENACFEK